MRRTTLKRTSIAVVSAILTVVVVLSVFRTLEAGPSKAAGDTPESRGLTVFAQNCSQCHYTDSRETKTGPGLEGLFDREKLPVSGLPVSEESVRRQLYQPYENMPRLGDDLSEEQIDDLIAYLKTI